MLKLNTLSSGPRKSKKRRGRGPGSGLGKTAGRGHKGQRSRAGSTIRPWFEGGQMPLQRRVPKRGFLPYPSKPDYQVVNLSALSQFDAGSQIGLWDLAQAGLVKVGQGPVKILAKGDLGVALHISAHAFSSSAKEKIEQNGGTVKVLSRKEVIQPPAVEV